VKRLVPIGGLGNRLRGILSARAAWGEVEVIWAASPAVSGGSFTDVFEPIERVVFTHAGNGHAHDLLYSEWGYDKMTSGILEDAPDGWTRDYLDLRPRPALQARIDKLRAGLGGPYTAIHARRCDHTTHAPRFGHFTTNEELIQWRQSQPDGPTYLATDCPETIHAFVQRFPSLHCHRTPERVQGYEVRPGTLADSVIDLFVCVAAERFKGCWVSSFSETIDLIRCKGAPDGGFVPLYHMPSSDVESYRDRPDRVQATLRGERWKP
jgi:hypothetical protein